MHHMKDWRSTVHHMKDWRSSVHHMKAGLHESLVCINLKDIVYM